MYEGDSEMDRCHRHPEESWSSPRDCQGINKVCTKNFFQQTSWHQHRSESWVFSMYNGECYDLISQLANLGMRKLISEDSYHQVWIEFDFWWWWKWGILCWNTMVMNTPKPTRISTCYWSEARMCQRRHLSWSGTLMLEKTLKRTGGWVRLIIFTYSISILQGTLLSTCGRKVRW